MKIVSPKSAHLSTIHSQNYISPKNNSDQYSFNVIQAQDHNEFKNPTIIKSLESPSIIAVEEK